VDALLQGEKRVIAVGGTIYDPDRRSLRAGFAGQFEQIILFPVSGVYWESEDRPQDTGQILGEAV